MSKQPTLPLALNDFFTFSEDTLFFGGVQMLDVTANDRGGRAIRLHSVDDGINPNRDLLRADPKFSTVDAVTHWETSQLGARFAIVDGQVAYDASTVPDLKSLAVGETLVDKITYAISLPGGKLSYATVSITITGSNDSPIIWASTGDALHATISEDSVDPNGGSISATGTVTVSDADLTDSVSVAVTNAWMSWPSGNLTPQQILPLLNLSASQLAADPGTTSNLAWTFTGDAAMFDYLEEGQNLNLYYEVTVTDAHGGITSNVITITVTGTSLPAAPVITVGPNDSNVATLSEGPTQAGSLNVLGSLTATDANPFDVLMASVSGVAISGDAGALAAGDVLGLFSLNAFPLGRYAGNINWIFAGNSSLFDYLTAGQQVTLAYTVAVGDGKGGTDTEVVNITITGSNETPVVSLIGADTDIAIINEDGSAALSTDPAPQPSFNGTLTVNDPDSSGTMSATVIGVQTNSQLPITNETYLSWFDVSLSSGQSANNVQWTFEMHPEYFDALGPLQTMGIVYTVAFGDGLGGVATRDIVVVLKGHNDPVVRSLGANDTVAVQVGEDNAAASGNFSAYDPDMQDFLLVGPGSPLVQVDGNLGTVTMNDLLSFGHFQVPVRTSPSGMYSVGWSFTPSDGVFDYLAEGEQVIITYNMLVTDGMNTGITQPFSITITGAADLI